MLLVLDSNLTTSSKHNSMKNMTEVAEDSCAFNDVTEANNIVLNEKLVNKDVEKDVPENGFEEEKDSLTHKEDISNNLDTLEDSKSLCNGDADDKESKSEVDENRLLESPVNGDCNGKDKDIKELTDVEVNRMLMDVDGEEENDKEDKKEEKAKNKATLLDSDSAATSSPLSNDVMVVIPNPDLSFVEVDSMFKTDIKVENDVSIDDDDDDDDKNLVIDEEKMEDVDTKKDVIDVDLTDDEKDSTQTVALANNEKEIKESVINNEDIKIEKETEIEDKNENKTIVLDDDDCVIKEYSESTVATQSSEKTTIEKDGEIVKDQAVVVNNEKADVPILENDKIVKDLENKKKSTFEPIIPLNFMNTFKSNLGKMTREELEEYCLVKIAEAIVKRSNISEAESRLKTQAASIDLLRKTLMVVSKQNRDLEVVMKNLINEHKKRKNEIIEPVKISRSVGFQVGSSILKKPQKTSNTDNTAPTNTSTPPSTQNKPKAPVQNNAKQGKVPNTMVVIPTMPTNSPTSSSDNLTVKKVPITNQAAATAPNANNNKKPEMNIKPQKSGMKTTKMRPTAEKRPLDQSIDLTDDEPPAKQAVTSNNTPRQIKNPPQNRIPNKIYVMNQQHHLPKQQQSAVRPRMPNSQNTNSRMGIPIKVSNNMTSPKSLSTILSKHPAPLPPCPSIKSHSSWKAVPPKPELKISKVPNGIVISWIMEHGMDSKYEHVASYQIYAYQETSISPSTDLWKKIGDVKALPLPMACTLTQFMAGFKYYFAVRAVDVKSRFGPFSIPGYILLTDEK